MFYSEGFHQTARSPNDLQIQGLTFRVYSYMMGLHSAVVTTSVQMRVSHSGTSNLKIPEIKKYFDLHGSPVEGQPLSIVTLYFLCVSYGSLPTIPGNMKAWACIMQTHQSVKLGEIQVNYGNCRAKCPILKGSIKRLDLQMTFRYRLKLSASIPL